MNTEPQAKTRCREVENVPAHGSESALVYSCCS